MFIACHAALDFGVYLGTSNAFHKYFPQLAKPGQQTSDADRECFIKLKQAGAQLLGSCEIDYIPSVHVPDRDRDPQFNIPYATFNPFGVGIRITSSDAGGYIRKIKEVIKATADDPTFRDEHLRGGDEAYIRTFDAAIDSLSVEKITIDIFPHGVGSITFHCKTEQDSALTCLTSIVGAIDDCYIRNTTISSETTNSNARTALNVRAALKDFKNEVRKILVNITQIGSSNPIGNRFANSLENCICYGGDTIDSCGAVATIISTPEALQPFLENPGYLKLHQVDNDFGGKLGVGWVACAQAIPKEEDYKYDCDRAFYLRKTLDIMWWLGRVSERYLTKESEKKFDEVLITSDFKNISQELRFLALSVTGHLQPGAISHTQNDIAFLKALEPDAQIAERPAASAALQAPSLL